MEVQRMKKSSYKDDFEFKQKLDYLKKTVDQHYLLTSLGFELERDSAKEYRGSCIVHGGDNKTAFRFNKELGTWVCFTSKCHETFGNDIIGLIMAVKKVGFMDALRFLESLVGDIDGNISEKMNYNYRHKADVHQKQQRLPKEPQLINI